MHNLSCENEFYLHENEKWSSYQRLSTYPGFETEAQGNSEMAYWPNSHPLVVTVILGYPPQQAVLFCVLLPEASLAGLVRSVVHGKHVRPYAGKPSETEWIRTRVRCHHYNQYPLHRNHHHSPSHQCHQNYYHHHHHYFYHDKISECPQ